MLNNLLNAYIGRVVVALTVILTPFVATYTNWILDHTGVDLPSKDITVIIVAVIVGVAATVYKWLANRGAYEKALLELERLYESGKEIITEAGDTTAGPTPLTATTEHGEPLPKRPL